MTKREFLDTVFALAPNEANKIMDAFDEYVDSNEPHWIPVTERLPEKEEKSYWVCLEGGGQCQCRWTNDMYGLGANEWSKWGWHVMDKPQYSIIVAWMPLPEPYKGGDGMKLCKDCEHFSIRQQPIRPHYDTGLAECKKYNMVVDFYDMKKFNTLSCVGEKEVTE